MSNYGDDYPPTTNQALVPPPAPPKRRTASCLLIGCLTALGAMVICGILAFFAIKSFLAGVVEDFTDTEPMLLPEVSVSSDELESLLSRVEAFKQALETGTPAAPLVLSGDEINALILHNPDFEELKGKVYISIEEDQVRGQVSIPLEPLLEGRYFNGSATFNIFLMNGRLFVFAESFELKDTPVPEQIMAEFSKENLAKDFAKDPEVAAIIDKLESIEVKDGSITITPKAGPEG